jgi:HD-like signal output (HDOD) protein
MEGTLMQNAVADVLDHLTGLPPFPRVTAKLLTMLNDDTVSTDELSQLILSDPSLVVKVLHLANSPFYMVSKPVENVKDAVLVLGISTIKSITTAASIQKGLAAVRPQTSSFDMLAFWRHSYGTAIAASKLTRIHDRRMADTLYVAGLIHDIGKMVIAFYWPDVWRAIAKSVSSSSESYDVAEMRIFGWSHAQIGGRLCTNWQFPDHIASLVGGLPCVNNTDSADKLSLLHRAHVLSIQAGFDFPSSGSGSMDDDEFDPSMKEIADTLNDEVEYQLRVLDS